MEYGLPNNTMFTLAHVQTSWLSSKLFKSSHKWSGSYYAVVTRSQLQSQIILWRKVEGHSYQIQCRLGPTFEVDRHTVVDWGTLWHIGAHCCTLWHTVAHCCTLWHTEAHCCTLLHTGAHWGFGNHCFPGHLSMLRLSASPLQADLINPIAGRIL